MIVSTIYWLLLLNCAAHVYSVKFPGGASCGLSYEQINSKPSWVCDKSQFQAYPAAQIDTLLQLSPTYDEASYYLNITKNCQAYIDKDIYGENEYYYYESLCRMVRKPVRVIWATVPGFPITPELEQINAGLLPCHVLEGQNLFDVECLHPLADGQQPPRRGRGGRRRGQGRRRGRGRGRTTSKYVGYTRNLCQIGYAYVPGIVCKPTGYMNREVLVYSEHAKKIFSVVVPDVPTSCACSYCECQSPLQQPTQEIPVFPSGLRTHEIPHLPSGPLTHEIPLPIQPHSSVPMK